MFFIGICGASASGKTTFANKLVDKIEGSLVLNQDAYYRDRSTLSALERSKLNYDHPASFDHDSLKKDILALYNGKAITRKSYDYVEHCCIEHANEVLMLNDVLIVEGIHAFYDEQLRDMMDLKIYLHVEPDTCLLRRIKRDLRERCRDFDSIEVQYRTMVKPMFDQYIRNYEKYADLIVSNDGEDTIAKVTDIIAGYVEFNRKKGGE